MNTRANSSCDLFKVNQMEYFISYKKKLRDKGLRLEKSLKDFTTLEKNSVNLCNRKMWKIYLCLLSRKSNGICKNNRLNVFLLQLQRILIQ